MRILRTDGRHPDFIELCRQLDQNLDEIVGGAINREKFVPFNQLDDIPDAVLIYTDDMPVAGGGLRRINASTAEIKRIFVAPQFRGRGLSKILMRELEERALRLRYDRLILETGYLLEASVGLYTSVGFTQIENYGPYVGMDESLCMGKEIGIQRDAQPD